MNVWETRSKILMLIEGMILRYGAARFVVGNVGFGMERLGWKGESVPGGFERGGNAPWSHDVCGIPKMVAEHHVDGSSCNGAEKAMKKNGILW